MQRIAADLRWYSRIGSKPIQLPQPLAVELAMGNGNLCDEEGSGVTVKVTEQGEAAPCLA